MRVNSGWLGAVGWLSAAAPAVAQTAPPAATPSSSQSEPGEVLVVARTGDRSLIDRKTYEVRDTPAAQTKTAIEVLQTLPAVSVDARGNLQLLGDANVKVLVDGRSVPGGMTYVRTLQASQIARIEVITNPSAQFASDGTAGVINIITRKIFQRGLRGSTNASAGSLGGFGGKFAPTWSHGKWSVSDSLVVNRNVDHYRHDGASRGRFDLLNPVLNQSVATTSRSYQTVASVRAQAAYKISERRSLSFTASATRGVNDDRDRAETSSPTGAFAPFSSRRDGDGGYRFAQLEAAYNADGARPDENLSASLSLNSSVFDDSNLTRDQRPGGAAAFQHDASFRSRDLTLKADYVRPVGTRQIVTIGTELSQNHGAILNDSFGRSLISPPRAFSSLITADWFDAAAYATYQLRLGRWKLLPGVRIVSRDYDFSTAADGVFVNPSLHLERPFGKTLVAHASYSRRLDWPDYNRIRPVIQLYSATSGSTGNPALKPSTTDAYELSAALKRGKQSLDLTVYDRVSHHIQSNITLFRPDGLFLSQSINAGTQVRRGGELSLRGPLGKRWRYSASLDAADEREDRLSDAAVPIKRSNLTYSSNLQLEYTEPNLGKRGFDQITANLHLLGPRRDYQSRTNAYAYGDITWTHNLNDRLSMILLINNPWGRTAYRFVTTAPTFTQRDRSSSTPGARLTLNYLFKPAAAAK